MSKIVRIAKRTAAGIVIFTALMAAMFTAAIYAIFN